MEKLNLKFVNKGKPFVVSKWTVEKHEEALALCLEATEELSKSERDKEFRYYVIYVGLKEVDANIDFEAVHILHPENVIDLFNIIYGEGKVDIFFRPKKSIKKK